MSVVASPIQIVPALAVADTVGAAFTATVTVAVLLQPGPFVPVTVYVVVADGLTVTDEPLNDPGIHVYVAVPFAVSVALPPVQMLVLDETVTVGCAPTVTAMVCVPVQPFAAVPVTVYVVVDDGVTLMFAPLRLPGIQL